MQRHIFDFRVRPENRKLEFSRNLNLWDYKQSQENKSTITAPAVAVIFFPHIHILAARSAMRAALFYWNGLILFKIFLEIPDFGLVVAQPFSCQF